MTTLKTVDKAVNILTCFSTDTPDLSVTEIALKLSMHKSIASRLAASLRAKNMLEMDPITKRYRIGSRLFELGQLYLSRDSLTEIAMRHLEKLVDKVGHASHLGVLDKDDLLISCCVESSNQLQVAVQAGVRRSIYATSSGKLFLAFGHEDIIQRKLVGGKFPKIGPNTITTVPKFLKELEEVRKNRVAYNREESIKGAWAVAAPVFNKKKEIIASVTTIFPLGSVNDDDIRKIEIAVCETAKNIEKEFVI